MHFKSSLVPHPQLKLVNTADLRTYEKAAVFGNRRYWESYITYKTLIWDLEMGGGIGRGGIGGDDCIKNGQTESITLMFLFYIKLS